MAKGGKSKCRRSYDDAVEHKPYKCLIVDCKKIFTSPVYAIKHAGRVHKNGCWICRKDGCTLVVNESEFDHICVPVKTPVDVGRSAALVDGMTKSQLRKEMSRY